MKMDKDVDDLFDQGLDHFNVDLYDEAIEVFSDVIKIDPDHPDALYYRALAWLNKGDLGRAIADFTQAIEKDPRDADCFIGRGEAWQSKGNLKRAFADFKAALSIEPDNPDYRRLVDDLTGKSGQTIRIKSLLQSFSL
jgi:tetratricopeptide (TPR) repeat protein